MFRFESDKKYLITVSGTSDAGKSRVLSLTIDKFIQNGATLIQPLYSGTVDSVVVIEYNKHKIGISTGGDHVSILNRWLPALLNYECDFIITATKSQGDTCIYVNDFARDNDFVLIPLHKYSKTTLKAS